MYMYNTMQLWLILSAGNQANVEHVLKIIQSTNWPYPQSSKMRKLPIIHVNVDLPVSGFAHMFFMQNAYNNTSARRLSCTEL